MVNDRLKLLYIDNIIRLYDAKLLNSNEAISKVMKVVWTLSENDFIKIKNNQKR